MKKIEKNKNPEKFSEKIKIIFAPTNKNNFLVIEKPHNLPSAPLKPNDECALNQAIKIFPQIKNVKGKKNLEYGMIHRLDTATRGLILIATTQKSYDAFCEAQKNGLLKKKYRAICQKNESAIKILDGFPRAPQILKNVFEAKSFEIKSQFRFYGKNNFCVRPVTIDSNLAAKKKASSKIYSTKIKIQKIKNDFFKADCEIAKGFRHQVRAHLAWVGFPILGDALYNPKICAECKTLKFIAYEIDFPHPEKNERVKINLFEHFLKN